MAASAVTGGMAGHAVASMQRGQCVMSPMMPSSTSVTISLRFHLPRGSSRTFLSTSCKLLPQQSQRQRQWQKQEPLQMWSTMTKGTQGPQEPAGVLQQSQRRVSAAAAADDAAAAAGTAVEAEDATAAALATLKAAAASKAVDAAEVIAALQQVETAAKKLKASDEQMLTFIGGSASPGKSWRLVFTSNGKKGGDAKGSYFPLPAIQRFDSSALEIENGVFLGPVGYLTFTGPFSFISRRLAFTFHTLTLRLLSLPPFKFNIGKKEDEGRLPGVGKEGKNDPFFVWYFADNDIIVARGRGGGVAFWTKQEEQYK